MFYASFETRFFEFSSSPSQPQVKAVNDLFVDLQYIVYMLKYDSFLCIPFPPDDNDEDDHKMMMMMLMMMMLVMMMVDDDDDEYDDADDDDDDAGDDDDGK